MTMKSHFSLTALGAAALTITACSGSTTSASQTTQALVTAQCTFQATRAAVEACKQALDDCLAQEAADAAACRTTFEACLPPPPDGGMGGPGRGGHHRPPDADGGVPPEGRGECMNGEADGGMGPGGRGGREGHHQRGAPLVEPDATAIQACHDALAACLTTTETTCFDTERSCEREAFAAAFAAACAAAQPCASTDTACTELEARCAEGVDGRPDAFDGGTCP